MLYVLRGDPIAMARPRFGRGHVYDPQAHLKLVLGLSLRQQHGNLPPYKGPLDLKATFFVGISSRINKKNRLSLEGRPALINRDLDNLIKMIGDLGQQAGLYVNDLQIWRISAEKIYTVDEPRTEFEITELK